MRFLALACLILVPLAVLPAAAFSKQPAGNSFHGSACTKDCSGHKAGYALAAKKRITRLDDCRGRSQSFVKGCRLWVEQLGDSSPK